MLLLCWYWKSFNASQGYWEVEIDNEGPRLALVLRLVDSDSKSLSRRIVFKGIEASGVKLGTFKLPDDAYKMSGMSMTFRDVTLRPGRVRFEFQGHEIDIMVSAISIDGMSYAWDQLEPIEIVE
ncbi:hypothetical protein [uncultured Gimesia sp.]|uniref:hypothetical protein n=1 Tax=uncultured Gimesia sp. TaxID=1678688 RepID=UPI0026024BFC|nr:hypothetical protein [uncultured Gimesia sp.]